VPVAARPFGSHSPVLLIDAAQEIAMSGPSELPVLHQFARSHYNEKARWGLDWKRVAHRRETYLPGPHAAPMKKLSGQSSTPVLMLDGAAIAGSAAILDALERRYPERPLYPEDPALRERALAIQRDFDAEVGVAARTAVFSVLLEEPGYLCETFAGHRAQPARALYRAAMPALKPLIAKANGVTDAAAIERAFARTEAALDFVARTAGASGYLVGDAFSVADLCCAALLAVVVDVEHPDMRKPQPRPARVEALLARFAAHPGSAWVRERYARNRPPSCAVAG
jgi:glutathione S-transferase